MKFNFVRTFRGNAIIMDGAKTTRNAAWVTSTFSTRKDDVLKNETEIPQTVETYLTSGLGSTLDLFMDDSIIGSENDSLYYNDIGLFSKAPWYLGVISLIYGVIIVLTIVGNVFVMVAYHRDPRIRRSVANTFILNLAIADFIVGAFTLPVYFGWNLVGKWIFGEYLCKVWSFVDFTVTAMSVITIILISLDRYWLLSKKAAYGSFQTQRRVNATIGTCWAIVSAIFLVLIFAWSTIRGEFPVDFADHCESEFVFYLPALICIVVTNFAIPALIIAMLNVQVYRMIRQRAKGIDALGKTIERESGVKITSGGKTTFLLRALRKKPVPPVAGMENAKKGIDPAVILVSVTNKPPSEYHHNPAFEQQNDIGASTSSATSGIDSAKDDISKDDNSDEVSDDEKSGERRNMKTQKTSPKRNKLKQKVFSVCKISSQKKHDSPEKAPGSKLESLKLKLKRKQKEFKRERKAALLLAVLVSVFICCWLPFNITVVVGISCQYECIPQRVFIVVENLVWTNSALNPILYAFTNVHFRRNFLTFLGFGRLARKLEGPKSAA